VLAQPVEVAEDSPPLVSERVAKLLAKKAERKARKALLNLDQKVGACVCKLDTGPQIDTDCTTPSAVAAASSSDSLPDLQAAAGEADSEPMDETECASTFSLASAELAGEQQDAEPGKTTPCAPMAAICSDKEEDLMSEETAFDLPTPWLAEEEFSSSEELQQWVWPPSVDRDDGWMKPFDDLIGGLPASPNVCIWKGTCTSDAAGKDAYTDGQSTYQPVPSQSGQPLYTDGAQLFMPVCVVAADSAERLGQPARTGPSPDGAFDPYDPLGLACPQENEPDGWDSCWG